MFIYIDESGSFAHPPSHVHSYACAGALTIPDRFHTKALELFKRLKKNWSSEDQEPKGSNLTECQVAEVVELLLACQAKFHVCATDMAHNTPDAIHARKVEQANRLLANVTDKHQPSLVQELKDCQDKMKALPDQLFVQLCVMTCLVTKHLHDTIIHYALADPSELGEFRWVVDRKDKTKTTYEDLWHTLLSPFIQGRQFAEGLSDRIVCVAEGDYSYFEKFCDKIDKWPDHLPAKHPGIREEKGIDIIIVSKILRDSFILSDSASTPGLQLADIITNTFRRAISGRLQYSGWKNMGKLMFGWRGKAARLVQFGDSKKTSIPIEDDLCAKVIMEMTSLAGSPLET